MVLKGVSNAGKSCFLDLLKEISPCEEYIQQHGSRFSIDYSLAATFDHTKYLPSFILVDEGAYSDLLDNGDLADAKDFFGGKGRAL